MGPASAAGSRWTMIGLSVATVFIPSMLRRFTGGCETVDVPGSTVRDIVNGLTELHPELAGRLLDDGQLRGNISVAIDGEVSTLGMLDSVEDESEVHFIPAISGGRTRSHADSLG